MEKYARASKCQLFHFLKRFFASILGFSRPNTNPSPSKQTQWKCGVLRPSLLTFSVILQNDFVAQSNQTTARPTNSETGRTRTYSTTNETQ